MSSTLIKYISEFANSAIDSFISDPTSAASMDQMTTLIRNICRTKIQSRSWFQPSSTLLILSSLRKILSFIRDNEDITDELELIPYLSDLLSSITPKDMALASGTTTDEHLKDVIEAVPNKAEYDRDDFFDWITSSNFPTVELAKHIYRHSIVQKCKHLICLNNADWSFIDLPYVRIDTDENSISLCNNGVNIAQYRPDCLKLKVSENYGMGTEQPKSVLQQSGVKGEENCTGELLILRSLRNLAKQLPKIHTSITHFVTQLLNMRKSNRKLKDSDLLYSVKFITAFNILLMSIARTYPNQPKLIESCIGQAKIQMHILNTITVSEISLLKDSKDARIIIEHLIMSTNHSYLSLPSDMSIILDNIGKRATSMYTICSQNVACHTDTADYLKEEFIYSDEFVLADDVLYGQKEALKPDQITPADEECFRTNLGSFSSLKKYLSSYDDKQCAICCGNWKDSAEVALLPNCSHIFCLECLKLWFSPKSSCEK